jgi:uncharacterized protein (DUF433 family)
MRCRRRQRCYNGLYVLSDLPDILQRDADGVIRFVGSRVRLVDVAARYEEGYSPEAIVSEYYPTLSLAQVYRAITTLLENEADRRELLAQNAAATAAAEVGAKSAPSLADLRQRLAMRRRPEAS